MMQKQDGDRQRFKIDRLTEIPYGLNVWLENKKNQDGFRDWWMSEKDCIQKMELPFSAPGGCLRQCSLQLAVSVRHQNDNNKEVLKCRELDQREIA